MLQTTGLLIGRAYALAHTGRALDEAVSELVELAAGDRMSMLLAQARVREFTLMPTAHEGEHRVLELLTQALQEAGRAHSEAAA